MYEYINQRLQTPAEIKDRNPGPASGSSPKFNG